jgi:hypothetical protein
MAQIDQSFVVRETSIEIAIECGKARDWKGILNLNALAPSENLETPHRLL